MTSSPWNLPPHPMIKSHSVMLLNSLPRMQPSTTTTTTEYSEISADSSPAIISSEDPFHMELSRSDWTEEQQATITMALQAQGLYDAANSGPSTLLAICEGLSAAEISQMLIRDFSIQPLMANQIRIIVVRVLEGQHQPLQPEPSHGDQLPQPVGNARTDDKSDPLQRQSSATLIAETETNTTNAAKQQQQQQPLYKTVVVNAAAVRRRQSTNKPYSQLDVAQYPIIKNQLDQFYQFMTEPSTLSQEDPIRPATANVYLSHAKLFLGWYVAHYNNGDTKEAVVRPIKRKHKQQQQLSLHDVLSKDKESATVIIQFIMWLRKERQISVNYEANLLRGIIKLLKFCFASESQGGDNRKTYEDIPVIQELRRLHRNAFKQAKLAPKSSNEGQKWLSWPEYLTVVQTAKAEYQRLIKECEDAIIVSGSKSEADARAVRDRKAAVAFQRYLVLAVFTNVPDRQRTIRELEIGRTLVKEDNGSGRWYIKHNPGDYKTGATYGERPPMVLSADLSFEIDEFVDAWRPKLLPTTSYLFVQPKTGNPFTRDSVYSAVSRACYEYAGKRTNPHLLRDMIVTHVRESDASEKELEALALYMGHSIQMQRTSYDRRTLERKVAPAIELLQSVNSRDLKREQQ